MKIAVRFALAGSVLTGLVLSASAVRAAGESALTFFVAPGGSDAWSGGRPDRSADGKDGPFATIARARDAVRAARATSQARSAPPAKIEIRGGTYELSAPIELSRDDGNLTLEAYNDEKPILSGGQRLGAWTVARRGSQEVWTAKLPPDFPKGVVRGLWIDGRRQTRARFPAQGYLKVESASDGHGNWKAPAQSLGYFPHDLDAVHDFAGAEAVVMDRWVESRVGVKSVDPARRRIEFDRPTVFSVDPGDVYYLEGSPAFLTTPGQWSEEASTGEISYLPMPGETPDKTVAVVAALEQVLRIDGQSLNKAHGPASAERIAFRELTFAYTRWDFPTSQKPASGFHQAAVGVGAAVFVRHASHCQFDHCTVAHTGGYGIELEEGCQDDQIDHCTITDLGAGGIKIGQTAVRQDADQQTARVEIADCRITDGGYLFPSGVGAWFGQTYDDRLVHNEIADFYYTGISVGWTWGYKDNPCRGNVVEHNNVHHIGVKRVGGRLDGPILSDMGGIYTLGKQPGTVIRGNQFHDIAGIKYGGWGIYFDEGSSDIVAENNLVYRTTHGGFHQHYGANNVFRNNILAFGRDLQIQRTRPEDHRSFTFERNLVYWDSGNAVGGNWANFNALFDHNLYWSFGSGKMEFGGLTWGQWRQKGMDRDSIVADPRFVDPAHNNFSLRADSPASKIGFKSFDPGDVGPRN